MTENIFDLAALEQEDKNYEIKTKSYIATERDKEKALKNFILVDRIEWNDIPIGSNIRYERKTGEFVRGGILSDILIRSNEKKYFSIQAGRGKGWEVAFDSIEKVWKSKFSKVNNNIDNKTINDMKNDIEYIKSVLEEQKKEAIRLSNTQLRIIDIIKKMNKKNNS